METPETARLELTIAAAYSGSYASPYRSIGMPAFLAISIASAAPFSGLSRPANTTPSPRLSDQGILAIGTPFGRIVVMPHAFACHAETVAMVGGGCARWTSLTAARTAMSGGRCRVWMTGELSDVASRTAGGSNA